MLVINKAMTKMSSVLTLTELKVDVMKNFLPLLVGFSNEYLTIFLIFSKHAPYTALV